MVHNETLPPLGNLSYDTFHSRILFIYTRHSVIVSLNDLCPSRSGSQNRDIRQYERWIGLSLSWLVGLVVRDKGNIMISAKLKEVGSVFSFGLSFLAYGFYKEGNFKKSCLESGVILMYLGSYWLLM